MADISDKPWGDIPESDYADADDFCVRVAWAAGLFEGEGWISTHRSHRNPYLRLGLAMNDEDVVRRFAGVVGCGSVRLQTSGRPRPIWGWTVSSLLEVERVVEMFWPWLGERRRARISECLASLRLGRAERRTERLAGALAGQMFGKVLAELEPAEMTLYRSEVQRRYRRRRAGV